jgi:segregation and condensation protein A
MIEETSINASDASPDDQLAPIPEPFALKPTPTPRDPDPKAAATKDPAKEEASQSPFSVTVGQLYDGPLDLLLDLIRKQNIDIYDIPIALITAQFLDYCHQLRRTDVDSAGEFIYMASLLIHIKSKTLLPRDPSDVAGATEYEDPRRELVERLLEHERFKAAAQMLMQKQQVEEATWSHPGMAAFLREQAGPEGLDNADTDSLELEVAADTVDLVRVFQDILERMRSRPVLDVNEDSVTVAQMIDYVKRRLLMEDRPISPLSACSSPCSSSSACRPCSSTSRASSATSSSKKPTSSTRSSPTNPRPAMTGADQSPHRPGVSAELASPWR